MLAIAAQHGAEFYGLDIKQALIYGDRVYMTEEDDTYLWNGGLIQSRRDMFSDSKR
jgi:hypothetical protein